jgi:hypothetical protein
MSVNGINSNMLTFMHLNDKHMPVGSRDSSINYNITTSEPINTKSSTITKITIDNVPYFKKYYREENGDIIMIMNNIDLLNNYKKSIIFNEKYKIFVLSKNINNIIKTLYICTPFDNLDKTNGIDMLDWYDYVIEIKNNSQIFIINGLVKIYKKELDNKPTRIIDFLILNITAFGKVINFMSRIESMSNIIYTYDMFDLYKFDFQKSYDDVIKTKYNFCIESNILNKSIYNSIFTDISMTNNKEVSMVRDNFGYILQHIMITRLLHNRDDIKEICSNDMERHILLGNTMKRLNTTYIDEFMIKDKNAQFINIMNAGQIIFDTGNANLCIVGIDFLKKLGYSDKDFKPMLETATSGVGKGSITYNRYIELTLKIDPKVKNTSLNKEYTFIAFVGMETLKDTLLLGQSAHSLRQFFQDSYCIGYNSDRVEYEKNKAQTNKDYNEINSILDELIQIHTNRLVIEKAIMMYAKLNTSLFTRFLQLVDNKTDLNKYDILINKLQQIKKLLESEPNKSVYGEIFNKIIGQYIK